MKEGLKAKLIRSHLIIAMLGVVLIAVSFTLLLKVKDNFNELVESNIKIVQLTKDIDTKMQASISALRGWVSIKDEALIIQREKVWEDAIIPDINNLTEIAKMNDDAELLKSLSILKGEMMNLKLWQWRIADVAHTPGNSEKIYYMNKIVDPNSENIITLVEFLLNKWRKKLGISDSQSIQLMRFRSNFLESASGLNEYVYSDDRMAIIQSKRSLAMSKKHLLAFIDAKNTMHAYPLVVDQLKNLFDNFSAIIDTIVDDKKVSRSSIAEKYLRDYAMPLTIKVEKVLNDILSRELKSRSSFISHTKNTIILGLFLIAFMGLVMLCLSIGIAIKGANRIVTPINLLLRATQSRTDNELSSEIEVLNNDEVGSLTRSFNDMVRINANEKKKIKSIVDASFDVIVLLDCNGVVLMCNLALNNMFGYEHNEILNNNISNLFSDESSDAIFQIIAKIKEGRAGGGILKSHEAIAINKSGQTFSAVISMNELKVDNDRYYAVFIRDNTESKKKNEEINLANQELQKDNNNKVLISKLENISKLNDSVDMYSTKILSFFAENFNVLQGLFYTYSSRKDKIILVGSYGKKIDKKSFQLNGGLIEQAILDKKAIIINDIPSSYMKISSGLGQSTPAIIVIFPLMCKGDIVGVIELCFFKIVTEDEILQIKSMCLDIAINLQRIISTNTLHEMYKEADAQKQSLQQQEEELRSTNEELETQTQGLKQSEEELQSTNEELRTQIDTIKNQQEQIERDSVKLKESNQYKSEFIANMSHELRTPLNSMLILAEDLSMNRNGNLTQEQVKDSSVILSSGNDLLVLINDILDISKVEAGKMKVEMSNISIDEVLESIYSQFKKQAEKKGINFECSNELLNNCIIKTDQQKLMQILKNLLSNSIKFTQSGSVTVSAKLDPSPDNNILFIVSDTGIGIDESKQELIFSEFQQADGSTSRKYGGSGLGLSISLRLAKLINGSLSVKSKLNEGSVFTLSLACNANSNETKAKQLVDTTMESVVDESTPVENCNMYKVLVVEDDELIQDQLNALIQKKGNKVSFKMVVTNADAKSWLSKVKYDCIILDINLVDTNSMEHIRNIAELTDNCIPIIVYTARNLSEDEFKSVSNHVNCVLTKTPTSTEKLYQEMMYLMTHSKSSNSKEYKETVINNKEKLQGKKVLLVDDDMRNTFALSRILQQEGLVVEIADNGVLALDKIMNDDQIDVILMDIMMPIMDGYEAIKRIREIECYKDTPIIALTAKASADEREKCINSGSSDYMTKPIKSRELLQLIILWLSKKKLIGDDNE